MTHIYLQLYYRDVRPSLQGNMFIFHYTHISPIILQGSTPIFTGKYVYLSLHTYISNYTIGKYVLLFREICLSFITHIYLQLYYREVPPSLQGNMSIFHYTHISPIIPQGSTSIFQGNMSIFHYTHKSPIILQGSTSIFIGKYVYLSLHTYISNYTIGKNAHLYREICLSFITHIYLQLYYREVRPPSQRNMSIFHYTHMSPIIRQGSTSIFQRNMSIFHYTHKSPIILQGSTSIFIGKYVYLSLHTYISNYTIGKFVHLHREICFSFITHIYLQLYYREVRPSLQRNMSIFHYTHISPIILQGSTSIFIGKYVYLSLHTYISNYTIGKFVHLHREICFSFITHIYLQLYHREIRPSLQGNMSIFHYSHPSPIMLQGSTSIFIGKYIYLLLHTYISNYTIGKYVHLYRDICLSFMTHIYLQLYYREVRPSLLGNMSIFHYTHISPIILWGGTSILIGIYVYLSLHTYISNYTIGKYVHLGRVGIYVYLSLHTYISNYTIGMFLHLYREICLSFITLIYLQLCCREVRSSLQ